MELQRIPLEIDDSLPLQPSIERWIEASNDVLQTFWDRWQQHPIEQYVACDFRYVAAALQTVWDQELCDGRRFCEWGCGFAVITGIAGILGFDAVGIEAEPFLVAEARKLLAKCKVAAEVWQGNFLPSGAERFAQPQADHPSLGHAIPPAYQMHDAEIDDFALVFSYPWPGESYFIQEVFRSFARPGALLLQFLGPYEIELYRCIESTSAKPKTSSKFRR